MSDAHIGPIAAQIWIGFHEDRLDEFCSDGKVDWRAISKEMMRHPDSEKAHMAAGIVVGALEEAGILDA